MRIEQSGGVHCVMVVTLSNGQVSEFGEDTVCILVDGTYVVA
jgi:hypothetical protein